MNKTIGALIVVALASVGMYFVGVQVGLSTAQQNAEEYAEAERQRALAAGDYRRALDRRALYAEGVSRVEASRGVPKSILFACIPWAGAAVWLLAFGKDAPQPSARGSAPGGGQVDRT
jgi:hypothetical protein